MSALLLMSFLLVTSFLGLECMKCEGTGWALNPTDDACIKVIKKHKRTYSEARLFCQNMDGDLATTMVLRSHRRHAMGQLGFKTNLWIGIEDLTKAGGTFTDFDGNALTETPFMRPGPYPGRHCVTLKKGRWYPRKCEKKLFFICEKDAVEDQPQQSPPQNNFPVLP